ncbi:MAG: chemotaxis protein CheW [Hyphomicrobiales bacterium]|nr:chemotaxis protein CheW [Hyphomicrobiales bacterium]
MDDILKDFLVETAEHIEAAGEQLVQLERDPSDAQTISSIFRLVHTIKGTCGFLGLVRMAKIAHVAEGLIGRLRDGARADAAAVTLVLTTVDRIKEILAGIEMTGEEPQGDDSEILAALQNFAAAMAIDAPSATEQTLPAAQAEQASDDVDSPAEVAQAAATATSEHSDAVKPTRAETIRVTVDALESLMLLVSELVLTRNQLTEVTRANTDEAVKGALQRLSAVATDLQDAVMRARMQPMSRVFNALPRLARELAVDLGKKIELVVEGAETELDRQLIELVRDPLTHMIRNCADHGLESPQDRMQAGKPETGRIRVCAAHEAGQITIEVVDDGRGLDLDRIRQKALALGLATRQQLAAMPNDEICRFIFAPGFSTAKAVTNISGRGVGLDVVRDNIQAIGGTVGVSSKAGVGTRFLIRIPLTLAIAPSLIVSAGEQRFALPQAGVIEAVSIGPLSEHAIETVQGALVLRLRNEVLPVTDLSEMLGLAPAPTAADERLVIVMRIGASAFGVIVDSVDDVQEIVVKPLGSQLAHLHVYSGQTILGDGSVVLILDTGGLADALGLERTSHYRSPDAGKIDARRQTGRVVLLRAGAGVCKALPLSLITRIESVDSSEIEQTGQGLVIRHRGELMPLLPAADGVRPDNAQQPILVIGYGGETMGLLVDEIVDIVEDPLEIQIAQHSPGVIGTAEFGGKIAELLDLTHFIRAARPDAADRGVNRKFRILLVDDRLFFRDMLTPVLSAAGYNVTTRESAAEALSLVESGAHFDAIVTDIDMPDIDGYTFARTLRALPGCESTPIIALSPQANAKALQAARASGIDAVAGKFDRKMLLDILAQALDDSELGGHEIEDRILTETAA